MLVAGLAWSSKAQADVSDFGIDSVSASISTTQAGAHPDVTQGFDLKRDPADDGSYASLRNAHRQAPGWAYRKPDAVPQVPDRRFHREPAGPSAGLPAARTRRSAWSTSASHSSRASTFTFPEPLYLLPGSADVPARLGFIAAFSRSSSTSRSLRRRLRPHGRCTRRRRLTQPSTRLRSPPGAFRPTRATTPSASRPTDTINCGGPCGGSVPRV